MKLLVDVGVGKAIEDALRAQGHDGQGFWGIGLSLGTTLCWLLRLEGATSGEKVAIVKKIFKQHGQRLLGSFFVYQRGRLRIRS